MAASTTGLRSGGPHWLERVGAWVRAHPLAVDVLLAVVVGVPAAALSLIVIVEGLDGFRSSIAGHPPWSVLVGLAVAVEPVALAVRRVWPFASFAVVSAAVGVQLLTSVYWFMLSTMLVLVSLYSYCAYGRRSAPAVGLAVGTVGTAVVIVLGIALSGRPGDDGPLFIFVRLLPLLVAAWSLGMFRRVRLAYVAALEERAVRAEAEREERARRAVADERARIAREMHDVVAHALSVVVSQANGGRYAARADPGRAVDALGTIAETGRQALADTRGLLDVLRTDTGAAGGDDQLPQPTLRELPELLDRVREAGVPVGYDEQGTARRLGPAAELAVYRLVQEALTNTVKHAGPGARAEVRLAWSADGLTVTVDDDGRGAASPTDGGQGLIGMRERVAVVGGSVSAGPAPGGGFRVRARLPRHADAVREDQA